jgi:glutathione S-transferase
VVTLYQLGGAWGVSSVSPFCVKIETYLRMAGIPFSSRPGDPRKAPRGKVPWIEDEGTVVPDSQDAIEHLKEKYGDTLDAGLSEDERARGHALRRMLEEGTYFCMVHVRWVDEAGWDAYRPFFLPLLPPVVGGPILSLIRRSVVKQLWQQGTGRHPPERIMQMACADYDAVARELGDRDYLFGSTPTSFDATAYAFVASALAFPADSPVRRHVQGHAALARYRERIEERYFT